MLNELVENAGGDTKSMALLTDLAPADRAALQPLGDAGADAAVVWLERASEAVVLTPPGYSLVSVTASCE